LARLYAAEGAQLPVLFHLSGDQHPAKRGNVGGNSVEKRQHMGGALIVAHCRRACLLQPYDQAAQVEGIAPSSLDASRKAGMLATHRSIVLTSTSKWNAKSTVVAPRAMSLFAVSQYSGL
jgi:hypothetical protein